MRVVLANPRGFCAGVDRAVRTVEHALERFGRPVYVRHEIVHNHRVVDDLAARGAIFVEEIAAVPEGATVIFSAHGVSPAVWEEAHARGLRVVDATCPLVTKVHLEVKRHAGVGRTVLLIGHAGHPEVQGTVGHFRDASGGTIVVLENDAQAASVQVEHPERVAYATQTTLSVDDTDRLVGTLRKRFPLLVGPARDDICYATQNRQRAARELAAVCDVVLVVGAVHSSNSTRLREVASRSGVPAYLIDDASQVRREWLEGRDRVGITSGASAPEVSVSEIVTLLRTWWPDLEEELLGEPESITFHLPRELDLQRVSPTVTTVPSIDVAPEAARASAAGGNA